MKKLLSLTLIFALMSSGLVACKQRGESVGSSDLSMQGNQANIEFPTVLPSGKQIITLATLYEESVRGPVAHFNMTNPDYHIQVMDYGQYNTSYEDDTGLRKLNTEIISGIVPDILHIFEYGMPYRLYLSRGLLADLYPFIDNDTEYSRDDFVEGVFRATEVDGGLYCIFSGFTISSVAGHPAVLGPSIGWNRDEFRAVIDAHPEADVPFGTRFTNINFVTESVTFEIDRYIDWETGGAHFDTDSFLHLLEYANALPAEYSTEIDTNELIAVGRQIMARTTFHDFYDYRYYKTMFGGEIVLKGYPTTNRNGNTLTGSVPFAIPAASKNKDGAWEFLKMLLDKDRQLDSIYAQGFPTNKAAFDRVVEDAMKSDLDSYYDYGFELQPLTHADVEYILTVVSGSEISNLMMGAEAYNIVRENVIDYFNGYRSAEETAKIIQSRVLIFIAERS